MHRRARAIGLALTSATLLAGTVLTAASASAAPISSPGTCTFDKTTGLTTCVTTTPINDSDPVGFGRAGDGSPADLLCQKYYAYSNLSPYTDYGTSYPGLTHITAQGMTVTTTTYQGASTGKGKKVLSSVSHSSGTYTLTGQVYCHGALAETFLTADPVGIGTYTVPFSN